MILCFCRCGWWCGFILWIVWILFGDFNCVLRLDLGVWFVLWWWY